ncbi:MAG: methyltransferase domain-containing protein [Deltaproteobacteria bacterium]|nr:methyltransferase domain-containing protein [Deltaproteobacteria bacterium]
MEQAQFQRFCEIAHQRAGIRLGKGKEALVAVRVGRRVRALGLADAKAYLAYLEADKTGEELVSFLDVISTNHTYFYREPEHFDVLATFIKDAVKGGQRRFRLWCAASSSGEEPYTIAVTLCEAMGPTKCDVRLLATDISTDVLTKAQNGLYNEERVSKIPRAIVAKYFEKCRLANGEPGYRASEVLRRMVVFKRLNLSTLPFPMTGPLDVIFCRNVMMYLHDDVRTSLISECSRLLRNNGLLILGRCDTAGRGSPELRHSGQSVYIKE